MYIFFNAKFKKSFFNIIISTYQDFYFENSINKLVNLVNKYKLITKHEFKSEIDNSFEEFGKQCVISVQKLKILLVIFYFK